LPSTPAFDRRGDVYGDRSTKGGEVKAFLAVGFGGLLLVNVAGAQAPSESANDSAREAVTILRAVNTAEAELNATAGGYGSVATVLASPRFKEMFPGRASTTDAATATVGQSTLVLVVSEDQHRYQALITPSEACGVAMFTSQVGLIYKGRALGCETQS
jgi:hypothetical protein